MAFPSALLFADTDPGEDAAVVPAGALEAAVEFDAGSGDFFFVDEVREGGRLIEALAEEPALRFHFFGGQGVAVE